MHALEEVLVRTLRDFGLPAYSQTGIIGVWVGEGIIGSLGARVEHGVTYHGFALNVAPNLQHFALIIPCGLADAQITSMQRELGNPVEMELVRERVMWNFGQVFAIPLEETTIAQLPL